MGKYSDGGCATAARPDGIEWGEASRRVGYLHRVLRVVDLQRIAEDRRPLDYVRDRLPKSEHRS